MPGRPTRLATVVVSQGVRVAPGLSNLVTEKCVSKMILKAPRFKYGRLQIETQTSHKQEL